MCQKCSGRKIKHPGTKKAERCCNACYTKFFTVALQAEKDAEIDLIRANCREVKEELDRVEARQRQEQGKRQLLETEAQVLQQEIAQREGDFMGKKALLEAEIAATLSENQAFAEEISTLKTKCSDSQLSFQTSSSELSIATRELANLNVKINELKSLILQQEYENGILRGKIESSPPTKEKSIGKVEKGEEDLAKEVDSAKWRCEQLSKEQHELALKIREYEGKLRNQDEQLHILSAEIPASRTGLEVRKDETILQERVCELNVENQSLEAEMRRPKRGDREHGQQGCCQACRLS